LNGQLLDAGDDAATPLTPEERDGLIPSYISLRRELNEVEQVGIADADRWAFLRRRDVLDERFLRRLHGRMFGGVWAWAGQYRRSERNIGVDHWKIETDLHQLLGDVRYWVEHQSFLPDEIAVRFHQRLTWIHPFPNGNGRFSRLAADLLAVQLGRDRFSWGSGSLIEAAELRKCYVSALRAGDRHDFGPLLAFARS
jgi:Fic-DOC domain mobile mystery protein B